MKAPIDIELRVIDPAKNMLKFYGLTSCQTLFDELGLRIVWGRIGIKNPRVRTEVFANDEDRLRRRDELLRRRFRHGYTVHGGMMNETAAQAVERDIVEAHGLPLASPAAHALVSRWHIVTRELARFVGRQTSESLDLVDVSTLAVMYGRAEGLA